MASAPEKREEIRVAIRYNTLQVPCLPHERAQQVAEDFATSKLQRSFSYEDDFIHCPSDFNADKSRNIWILCDFNARDRLVEADKVPLQSWKVHYRQDGTAVFTKRAVNIQHFTNQYPWGGRDNEWEYRSRRRAAIPFDETMAILSIEH